MAVVKDLTDNDVDTTVRIMVNDLLKLIKGGKGGAICPNEDVNVYLEKFKTAHPDITVNEVIKTPFGTSVLVLVYTPKKEPT